MKYRYDSDGNRVYKQYADGASVEKTLYVRDAPENVLGLLCYTAEEYVEECRDKFK